MRALIRARRLTSWKSAPGNARRHRELAGRTDAGADVLHYLARHGAPATRGAVAANPAAPAATNRLLADDE